VTGWSRSWLRSIEKSSSRYPGLQRSAKFALVGALGIIVQLLVLELLTTMGCHYLWATGLAVEAAVLHNFMWHQRFTWKDRDAAGWSESSARLLRFHLSNGAISICGSLVLMRWLVGQLGMGVLVANLITVAACAVGNFLASDRWVFSPTVARDESVPSA
jgi:dolichol-phosphate mannosyltransferase